MTFNAKKEVTLLLVSTETTIMNRTPLPLIAESQLASMMPAQRVCGGEQLHYRCFDYFSRPNSEMRQLIYAHVSSKLESSKAKDIIRLFPFEFKRCITLVKVNKLANLLLGWGWIHCHLDGQNGRLLREECEATTYS